MQSERGPQSRLYPRGNCACAVQGVTRRRWPQGAPGLRHAGRLCVTAGMPLPTPLPLRRRCARAATFALVLCTPVLATADEPSALPYTSVAQALAGLKARDGDGTIVTDGGDGWVIVNEPMASAQWSFTPAGHAAYPAVVRRVIKRGPNRAVSVDVATLCEAPAAACAELLKSFEGMNGRITQAVGAQGRPAPVAR